MKLAVVGWAADSGVGRELIDAVRHLPVEAAFILENQAKPTRADLLTVPHYLGKGPNLETQMEAFLTEHKPTTILSWEVPGNWNFPKIWASRRVKWVHVIHWDWFAPSFGSVWRMATTLVAPNVMCRDALKKFHGLNSTLLPVPVDAERCAFKKRTKAKNFISIYGYGGQDSRRSLEEIYKAWEDMVLPPKLTVFVQKTPDEIGALQPHPRIDILFGNTPEPADLYAFGDVAVQPSRYEGVGVSMVEAQASGLPVIAVDAPPMNEVVHKSLLVSYDSVKNITLMGKSIPSYIPSPLALRKTVESLYGKDIGDLSQQVRNFVVDKFSWKTLKPRWLEVLR